MSTVNRPGYCTLCTSTCGAIYSIENDRIVSIRNDADHPTGGAMCLKGKSASELIDNPERLTHPMRRTNPKGSKDPGWAAISWDEALDEIAGRLLAIKAQSGAHAVAFGITTPNGTPIADSSEWIERFIYTFGSPNICYAAEICNWHKEIAHSFTYGCGMPAPDYLNSDLIVLWGHNPTNTWLAQAHSIGEARKAGAKLIVVDPRDTALAREADVWLRIRPGTDAALAMGLANAFLESGAYDRSFVHQWTNGALLVRTDTGRMLRGAEVGLTLDNAYVYFDRTTQDLQPHLAALAGGCIPDAAQLNVEQSITLVSGEQVKCASAFTLYRRACLPFDMEKTAQATWIDADKIEQAATLIASSQRISLHSWTGVEQHNNATQSQRAISCFYALTGCFDAQGGNRIFGSLKSVTVNDLSLLAPEQLEKALGYRDRPIGPSANGWVTSRELYEAILNADPYQIRALVSFGGNLLLAQSDRQMAERSFEALEFHVHCDLFINPTAEYADIVLPVNTPWEREALRIGFAITTRAQEWVQLRQQMVSPRHDTRSDTDIVFALAGRMGMREEFFGGDKEAAWNAMLAPLGLTTGQLRQQPAGVRIPIEHATEKYRLTGFNTASGLIEIYSESLHVRGYAALPGFEAGDIIQPNEAYPYVLSSAKSGYFCHSQHRQLAGLRKKSRNPTLELSQQLAAELHIADLDWVIVTTRTGQARFQARVNPNLHPRVVFGQHGWWQPCIPLGASGMPVSGPQNSNYNGLIDADEKDPVSGSVPLRAFTCSLRREDQTLLAPGRWPDFRDFYVSEMVAEANGVHRVHLRPLDNSLLPGFDAGQHITIRVTLRSGMVVSRAYSLVGIASERPVEQYAICVRNSQADDVDEPLQPSVSHHINRHLAPGDRVGVQAPGGNFTIPCQAGRPLVFHAGGIGITPFMTVLETAALAQSKTRMLLIYGNRNSAAHVFRLRLKQLKAQLPGLEIIDVYSRPLPSDQPGVDFNYQGYVDCSMIPEAFTTGRPLHYMCGAESMMSAMTSQLIASGVPKADIFKEAFKSSVNISAVAAGEFDVNFARSNKTIRWTSQCGVLLDFATANGITLASGCRVGQCESCAVNVLDGRVLHLQGNPDEDNVCLTCQAIPGSDITLDA
ncbi:molybdopterin-dependent oxidoreductase [Affinibrenneria salicis]|uniref:Molybdopterin-dependent oxidoreductase n=1 Tax=Affinibrenneria salicis TaxID=2590031 RepID=A0A5J5FT16_9GAMM|nr:molybdopterin-dependent oxidoreductase [Affinibrenneria salicis]